MFSWYGLVLTQTELSIGEFRFGLPALYGPKHVRSDIRVPNDFQKGLVVRIFLTRGLVLKRRPYRSGAELLFLCRPDR